MRPQKNMAQPHTPMMVSQMVAAMIEMNSQTVIPGWDQRLIPVMGFLTAAGFDNQIYAFLLF